MKEKFQEYFTPDEEYFKKLWKECTFVFDTNVLLSLYTFSDDVRDNYIEIFKAIKDRIWMPYQVGKEYFKNRIECIDNQERVFNRTIEKLEKIKNQINSTDILPTDHPVLNTDKIKENLCNSISTQIEEIKKQESEYSGLFKNDSILYTLLSLFEGKVGEKYSEDKMKSQIEEANKRYKNKIPPGYKDENKDGNEKYGDYLIWKQIIDYAKEKQIPIIYVTNDRKEDWWWINKDKKTLGPRSELRREFLDECGTDYYMYSANSFLKHATEYLKLKVNENTIEESQKRFGLQLMNNLEEQDKLWDREYLNKRFALDVDNEYSHTKKIKARIYYYNKKIDDITQQIYFLSKDIIELNEIDDDILLIKELENKRSQLDKKLAIYNKKLKKAKASLAMLKKINYLQ